MHSFAFLAYPVASVTTLVLLSLSRRQHSQDCGDTGRYYFPAVWSYLFAFAIIFFPLFSFLPNAKGNLSQLAFSGPFIFLSLVSFVALLYFHRYQVVVGKDSFVVGAFTRTTYKISDIADTKRVSGRAPEYLVQMRNGKRLRFSGLLTDFDRLTILIAPGGGTCGGV